MIKRAKTKKNLMSILSAVLGVVFALIVGVTYSVTSLQLTYDKTPYSTSAFLGNQQYHLINDTVDNPIPFGEGTHNFEIALQYSIDYNFDVRLDYELEWSNGSDASNVILNFANKDNIIYDKEHIFLASSTIKGEGKITFITGVEFVDVNNSTYYGQTLKIKINAVKIYKEQASYSLINHVLTKDIDTSLSAQMWINYKNRTSLELSYVLMYNQRRNFANGVPYPGFETAYKKPVVTTVVDEDTTITEVSGSKWLGGNKSYAGVGMYVVSGKSSLKLQVQVAAIWRENKNNQIVDIKDPKIISENSIKLNYSSEWEHDSWDSLKLWETRNLTFEIPAQTACYIDILDNIEVTTASKVATNMYDSYRAVINSIKINPGLTKLENEEEISAQTTFEYTESSADFVQMETIENNKLVETTSLTYENRCENNIVSIVNSSTYSNNLYSAKIGTSSSSQTFNTSISAINNTASTQIVTISYALKYYISNGNDKLISDSTGLRAYEMITDSYTDKNAFMDDYLYHAYSIDASSRLENLSNYTTEIVIAPYSSVSLVCDYKVAALLQSDVYTEFNNVYYDVWTYLDVQVTSTDKVEDNAETGYYSEIEGLVVESIIDKTNITSDEGKISVTTITLKVKNNTNKIIKGVEISSLTLQELKYEGYGQPVDNKPSDWDASYWKYYTKENDGSFTQITSSTLSGGNWPTNIHLKSQTYEMLDVVKSGDFTENTTTNTFTNASIELLPGESEVFATATATTKNTGSVIVSGVAKTSMVKNPNEFMLVNQGTKNAYFINNSETSYYLKFTGNLVDSLDEFESTDTTIQRVLEDETIEQIETKNNHYIGIVRPGQIINVPMISYFSVDIIPIDESEIFADDILSSWHADAVTKMKTLFGVE